MPRPERRDSGSPPTSGSPSAQNGWYCVYLFDASVTYAFEIDYSLEGPPAAIELLRSDQLLAKAELSPTNGWDRGRLGFRGLRGL